MSKYFNNAIIGNSNILGCLNDRAELIRLYYPTIDYFQNINTNRFGIIKNNQILWFNDAKLESQYYEGNIVYTKLKIDEYEILERDYVLTNKNVLVRTLKFNKKLNLFLYSKLNSDINKKVSGMIADNSLIQYCQEMYMATFAREPISNYQINNSKNTLNNGQLYPEDYIGMSEDSAILYNDINEITIYIALESTLNSIIETIDWCRKKEENLLYSSTKKYWENYLKKFENNIVYRNITKIKEKEIIDRTILYFALVTSKDTGAVLASPDIDETFDKCGRYGYCWPRDAIFINAALNTLGLSKLTDKFYDIWARRAQLKSGLFEQRYFTTGELAPAWGLQIDETAAMIIGIYQNGKYKKAEDIILKALKGLLNFLDEDYLSKPCFDIWEERKGKHLYSTASIYEALRLGKIMLEKIDSKKHEKVIEQIVETLPKIKESILKNFIEGESLKRSTDDWKTDISTLSLVVPFHILDSNDKLIEKLLEKMEYELKCPNGGYMRYQWDSYAGGNAWIISSLWLAMYYIEKDDINKAKELFDWVTNHADSMNFLPEQIDRNGNNTIWVRQLSWSHAMYILVKAMLINEENKMTAE